MVAVSSSSRLRVQRSIAAAAGALALAALTACASSATPGSGSSSGGGSSSAGTSGSSESASSSPATSPSAPATTGGSAAGTGAAGATDLTGKTFTSSEVTGGQTLVPGSTITLTFENGNISANAGCNTFFGSVDLAGNILSAPTLASTMMACEQALMDQDQWLSSFLASDPAWSYVDSTLELNNGTDTVVFSDLPVSQTAELEATGWKLTDLLSAGGSTVTAVGGGVTAWLRILPSGEAGLNTGCNGGGGSVEVTDAELTWGSLITTLIACEGDADTTERAMLTVLQGTTPYEIAANPSGATLTIMSTDGSQGLLFAADPTAGADMAVSSTVSSTTG